MDVLALISYSLRIHFRRIKYSIFVDIYGYCIVSVGPESFPLYTKLTLLIKKLNCRNLKYFDNASLNFHPQSTAGHMLLPIHSRLYYEQEVLGLLIRRWPDELVEVFISSCLSLSSSVTNFACFSRYL